MGKRENLRRRAPFRDPLPRVLIVCEGTKTEPGYFDDLRRSYRTVLEIEISPGGVPGTLVQRAVEMKKDAVRLAKSQRDDHLRFDEIWCVFDIDDHPNVTAAQQRARDNGIDLAISNPCFELWILLHFQDWRAHIARQVLRGLCRRHLPGYVKDVPADILSPLCELAERRAYELDRWQADQGRQYANPSTGVYKLTRLIREYGAPKYQSMDHRHR
jgi:hypothetical protein